MLKRAEIVKKLINEGFSHETLSSFSDYEITTLGMKIITELRQSDVMMQQAQLQRRSENCKEAFEGCQNEIQKAQKKLSSSSKTQQAESVEDYNVEDGGTKTLDTDNVGNPDVDIKKDDKDLKLITDKENLESVSSEMLENWMTDVVNKRKTGLTKSKMIEMVKNAQNESRMDTPGGNPDYFYDEDSIFAQIRRKEEKEQRTKLFDSVEQEYAFEQLNKYVLELDGYEIMVDELEVGEDPEESVLNLFLASNSGMVWDIMIYTDGNIYMDGAPIQDSQDLEEEIREKEGGERYQMDVEQELSETDRDSSGVYIGAPVGTEMPVKTPVRTPTTTPTTPKRRKGPFERPKTKPKPKAGKDKMPDWMGFDDIISQTENS